MDTLAEYTEAIGPFEQWRNPLTGAESAFVTFPVVDGRFMSDTVYLTDRDGHGRVGEITSSRWREWEIVYTPAVSQEATLRVWATS